MSKKQVSAASGRAHRADASADRPSSAAPEAALRKADDAVESTAEFKPLVLPSFLVIDRAEEFLTPLAQPGRLFVDLKNVRLAQIWSLVGLAALARREREQAWRVDLGSKSKSARFAHALGFEALISGQPAPRAHDADRSFPLQRVSQMQHIERAARDISQMMVQGHDDTRKTLNYVLVELLRNAVQHSRDDLGGVVAAQLMNDPDYYPRPVVQVAVADAGIGILQHLQSTYPELTEAREAIVESLKPHVSGTFGSGASGSTYNAGMGLFFISELAKLTAGRLLIATRGAAHALLGDPEGRESHDTRWVTPKGLGFPGTLVAFELPLEEVQDHESLLETIRERARQRSPAKNRKGWLRMQEPPAGVKSWLVHFIAEDVVKAEALVRSELHPRIMRHEPVALDFRGLDLATQSFLHALLYETLRLAWALRVPVYAYHADPAVLSGLKLVDAYAMSG